MRVFSSTLGRYIDGLLNTHTIAILVSVLLVYLLIISLILSSTQSLYQHLVLLSLAMQLLVIIASLITNN